MLIIPALRKQLAFLEQRLHASIDLRDSVNRAGHFLSRCATTMGGQLLLSYSTLFCATCLDAPEYVDGLWDYGGQIHGSAWFPASVVVTAGEAGVSTRDGWSADQNGGVARAVPTPERCRGRSSCVSDRARRYDVPRGEYRGCRVAYGGRMRLCRPVREAYEHRGVLWAQWDGN
ncbi:hypothetical protein quinque_002490 [Culex quinquefasciatus]